MPKQRRQNEESRLASLICHCILETEPEACYDNLAKLAASAIDAPMAAISLIDEHRIWFKATAGFEAPEV
ncbi:MAG TPA: hypothetical protein VK171_10730, partial [Fimbriimonas sp.]|nr:hypothetical protein [Fimbriimonas sp.]